MGKKQFHKKSGKKSNKKKGNFQKSKPFIPNKNKTKGQFFDNTNVRNLLEKDVAITEHVSSTVTRFSGIIKARFSDFQVNEIDMDGNEVKLTDISVPDQPKVYKKTVKESESEVKQLITEEIWNKISNLAKSTANPEDSAEINVDNLTKEQRSMIHHTIKSIYGSTLIGSTFDKDDSKFIRFKRCSKSSKSDQRVQWLWPDEYTYFILHKINIDTLKAVSELAKNLAINASKVSYAGTKDKRGKTSQWCCLRKIQPERISRAAKQLSAIKVGNFKFDSKPLKLGHLQGNRFRIALRSVDAENADIIENAMTSFRDNGFINYYGLQRFGNNASIPTHCIGRALLQSNFKEACELILKPRKGDPPFMVAVREHWWKTRNAATAMKMLYKSNKGVEAKLLVGLSKHGPNDYVNAFENIPRNMRLLYIHAYQSLIWNEIVSRRIKEFGLKVQVGDLVFADKNEDKNQNDNDEDNLPIDADDVLCDDESEKEDNDDAVKVLPNDTETVSRFKTMVKPLSQEEVDAGTYTIFDLVLPLPGHDITYPANEIGKWYEERLAKDDLSSEKLKLKQKTYSLCGAYRKIIIKVDNLSWTIRKYKELTEDLIRSDLDELEKKKLPEEAENGKEKALIIDFRLPSSSYATMALREIIKDDTSKSTQRELNDMQKPDEETADKGEDTAKDEDSGNGKESANTKEPENKGEKRKVTECEGDNDGHDEELKKAKTTQGIMKSPKM